MKKYILWLAAMLLSFGSMAQTLTARQNVSMTGGTNGFYEFKPSTYNGVTKHPAIIFIHGLGELGNGNTELADILSYGLPNVIAGDLTWFNQFNAVCIMPQFLTSSAYPGPYTIQNIINYVRNNYSVDTTRIYLTGMSMGGASAIDWGELGNVYSIAAMGLVCPADIQQTAIVNRYKAYGMPMYFFHSTDDGTVAFSNSTGWITALNGGTPINPLARMDTLTGYGHAAWDAAYHPTRLMGNGQTFYQWLFSKKRTDYIPDGVDDGNNFTGGSTPPPGPSDTIAKMNLVASGTPVTTVSGWTKLPDGEVTGGIFSNVYDIWGADRTINNATAAPQAVYKSSRLTSIGITINHPVPNGTYTVRLHFCEYWKNGPGINVFNVALEGTNVLNNLDVYSAAGGRYNAYYRDFTTTVSDGYLTINATPVVGDAMLNAFEVWVPGSPPANAPPTASAGSNQTITLPTSSVTLDGLESTDTDGSVVGYLWRKISGGSATIANTTGATTTVSGLTAGTYNFELKVTDDDGATDLDTVQITVNPAPPVNVPPNANAGADQTITGPTNSVTVNGAGSTDSDGSITGYSWVKLLGGFASITSPNAASTTITGLTPGTYTFKLTVTDNNGATDTDTMQVTVNAEPPGNAPPTANAGPDQVITLPTNSVTLNSSASVDVDGTLIGRTWEKIIGPGGTITSPTGTTTTVTGLTEGTYVFRLIVTDDDGATNSDEVTVTVNPAPPVTTVHYISSVTSVLSSGRVSVLIVFDDGTSRSISSLAGYYVRSARSNQYIALGINRIQAIITFTNGSTQTISVK